MTSPVSNEVLREVIRDVLREVVASEVAAVAGGTHAEPAVGTHAAPAAGTVITVRTQADLDQAIARVLADARDPRKAKAIAAGRTRFVLAAGTSAPPVSVPAATGASAVTRIERGALTERHVTAAGQSGAVITITSKVVITPLARERARALGVEIRREQ